MTTTIRALHIPDEYVGKPRAPWAISSLQDGQEMAISLLPVVSGLLSILGSSTIIYMAVVSSRKQRATTSVVASPGHAKPPGATRRRKWTPYTRLLFGMSCCDIVASLTLMSAPFLLPKASSQRVFAVGNDSTCSLLGFFQQFSSGSASLYNGFLSFYFLLTARFGWKNNTFAKRIEPVMHFLSICFPLATATAGAIIGVYHEAEIGPTCWVTNYPEFCEENGVTCQSVLLAWIFGGTIFLFAFFSIPINNLIIFFFVRRQTTSHSRRTSTCDEQRQSWSLNLFTSWKTRRRASATSATMISNERASDAPSIPRRGCDDERKENSDHVYQQTTFVPDSFTTLSEDSQDNEEAQLAEISVSQLNELNSSTDRLEGTRQQVPPANELQLRRLQLVATQAFLYVGAFFICTIWTFLLRIMESLAYSAEDESALFPLLVLQAWFLPLQGFFNVFIYVRPKYMKHRQQYPEKSKWWALRRSVNENYGKHKRQRHDFQTPFGPTPRNQHQLGSENVHETRVHAAKAANDTHKKHAESRGQQLHMDDDGVEPLRDAPSHSGTRPKISSITFEDFEDGSSSSSEGDVIQVEVNKEWRWMSGHNPRQPRSSGEEVSSSLEVISELSAVSFVDPDRDDANHDYFDILDCAGEDREDVKTTKSAPATCGDKQVRFVHDHDADEEHPDSPRLLQQKRRWSVGNTMGGVVDQQLQESQRKNQSLSSFLRKVLTHFSSSSDDDSSSSASSLQDANTSQVDPSFDRMESIKTSPRDAPVQRPTRRLSPVELEIPDNVA